MLCFDFVEEPSRNLSYGSHQRKILDSNTSNKPGRPRKLTIFQEFVMVLIIVSRGVSLLTMSL